MALASDVLGYHLFWGLSLLVVPSRMDYRSLSSSGSIGVGLLATSSPPGKLFSVEPRVAYLHSLIRASYLPGVMASKRHTP